MNHKNEQGYSLIGVLLIITIVAIVGVSLAGITLQSVKTSTKERDNQAVYYIAEAGMNYLTKEFEEAVLEAYNDESVKDEYEKLKLNDLEIPEMWDEFESVNTNPVFAEFGINEVNETTYELTSKGHIGSETRTVSRIVEVKYKLPPFAVFTSGKITGNGNLKITGNIGTLSTTKNAIDIPDNADRLKGKIYVPTEIEEIVKSEYTNIEVESIGPSYSMPILPDFPKIPENYTNKSNLTISNEYELQLNDNYEYGQINIKSGNTLKINLNNKDRSIVVDKLDINGNIKVEGKGSLTIYIKNEFVMKGQSSINEKNKLDKVNIYYKGAELKLNGGQKIYGSLYAERAKLDLTGSGHIYGNIFSGGKEIKMAGGSEIEAQLILAPKATVTMRGGSIKGRIMSKEYNQTGGATVIEKPFILTGPISPSALGMSNNENEGQPGQGNGNNTIETGNKPKISKEKVKEISH